MQKTELVRLSTVVRTQAGQLLDFVRREDREAGGFLGLAAVVLRSMLMDAGTPTLIRLARAKDVELKVWGPHPKDIRNKSKTLYSVAALVASWERVEDGYEMSIQDYVETPIFIVPMRPTSHDEPPKACFITPKDIVKWVANKEGPAHYDEKLPQAYRALQDAHKVHGSTSVIGPGANFDIQSNDNVLVKTALQQVSRWAIHAAHAVGCAPPGL